MHRLRRGETPRTCLGRNSGTVVNNYREACRGSIPLQRLGISGTKVLLPRFTPPKLTIAVGPAKLVETLGFCWGFETGHTHGKSAAVARRELFLRLDGPSARGHDFGVRLPAYRKEVLRYLREQGATEEQITMMLRHFGSKSAVSHRQPPF